LQARPPRHLEAAAPSNRYNPNELPPQAMSIVHIQEDTFESQVIKSSTPVLVDFWAEWCGPCKMIAPVLEQIATEYQGKLRIAKVDVDSNQATAMRYGVRSIPTLMLFRNGVVEAQQVGMISKDNLKKILDAKL
jgi:thioredoxin 1